MTAGVALAHGEIALGDRVRLPTGELGTVVTFRDLADGRRFCVMTDWPPELRLDLAARELRRIEQ